MHFSGDSMSKSIRMHPLKLYTGPRPCGELWSPCIFLPRFLFQQSYSTSTSSPFTSICIFHYQLQFRDYGGSLAHRLQLRFLLYAAGNVHVSFAGLRCLYSFPKAALLLFMATKASRGRHRRAGRPRSHEPCCASRGLA